ncbi:JAB domain-containing protein [Phascolarctobacterium succinatutens]|uniref:JAB domain-containing protein n=1 Tax=Phascolarctobacterium succinatutens TaxID=626940 RepID=UPI003AB3971A
MDLQIREAVEIYGSTKYISTENLLSAVLDSKKIGKIMGIPLLDHLIIGNGAYYSYAEADIDNW